MRCAQRYPSRSSLALVNFSVMRLPLSPGRTLRTLRSIKDASSSSGASSRR